MSESNAAQGVERKDLLKRALVRMERLEAELEAARARRAEPLAIVGLGCRFPGGAEDPDRARELLLAGLDATCDIPAERWDVDAYYDADPDAPGMMYVRRGAFLTAPVDAFDAPFFGIAPREADEMDPQQRLLLEVVWETLERAAQSPSRLRDSATGVYVGMAAHDWSRMQGGAGDTEAIGTYFGTGSAHSVAAGRIAYLLGLKGPAITVDTACSSSLVAFHLACQALRSGEVDAALAAGVSLVLAPDGHVIASRGRMLSPRGVCATFDASADGYVRGEGCGVVLLKRLGDAVAAGDPVLAVVRGTALNQDGRSGGITAPSGPAQEDVMRAALRTSGLRPDDIAYVETHGTGTELGDPIEVHALAAVHAKRPADRPLLIGSVKTNLGHLEGAAGIAGVIKTVLALRSGTIQPHLHFRTPNPHISWDAAPVKVVDRATPWPAGRRLAGVSSFGFSGTNAHVILEAYEAAAPAAAGAAASASSAPVLVPLSARSEAALRQLAGRIAERVERDNLDVHAVARTLARGRAHWEERAGVVGTDAAEVLAGLRAVADGREHPAVVRGTASLKKAPRPAFLFTGQGAQRPGMGRGLLAEPTFREIVDRCEAVLAPRVGVSIRALLEADPDDAEAAALLQQTHVTQPALFVLEYALAALWRSWGVEPSVVLGHSVGEIAAACAAGVLELDDALTLIAERGRRMGELPAGGAMATVFAPATTVEERLRPFGGRLSVAAYNAPGATAISGDADALDELLEALAAEGISARRLHVSHAFHSHRMEPALAGFGAAIASITHTPPRIDIIANRSGELAGADTFSADYWTRHIREPVRFEASIATLRAEGATLLVEVGPAPVLLGLAAACAGGTGERHVSSLRPGVDPAACVRTALAQLYVSGARIDWDSVFAGPLAPVELPTYPFQRERHWFAARPVRSRTTGEHPLLGRRIELPRLDGAVWEAELDAATPAWAADHRIHGRVVLPASALLEMCRAATSCAAGARVAADVRILEPLVLDSARTVQTHLDVGAGTIEIVSRDRGGSGSWRTHVAGTLADAPPSEPVAARPGEQVDVAGYRALLRSRGAEYGPAFSGLRAATRGDSCATGEIDASHIPARERRAYGMHPALLDAAFQVCGLCVPEGSDIYMPVEVGSCVMNAVDVADDAASSDLLRVRARLREGAAGAVVLTCDIEIETADAVMHVNGIRFQKAAPPARAAELRAADALYEQAWTPVELPAAAAGNGVWRVVGAGAAADAIAAALAAAGRRVETAETGAPPAHEVEGTVLVGAGLLLPTSGDALVDALRPALEPMLVLGQLPAAQVGRLCAVTAGAWALDANEPVDPVATALWGLGQTIAAEAGTACRRIDVALDTDIAAAAADVAAALLAGTSEDRLALRRGRWHAARLDRRESGRMRVARPAPDYRLVTVQQGELDGLVLEAETAAEPGPDEVRIRVSATGLNFRDVLNALGMYPGDAGPLGSECVGIVDAVGSAATGFAPGDRVMAVTPRGFCSRVNAAAALTVHCPDTLADGEAATVPIAFLTADWGLFEMAGLRAGERVLVHAAAGGVGLAAVQLARAAGAEVFATAGSARKRALLRRMGVRHIYDSRSTTFREQILEDTGGAGVHVVLNSLADDFIPASLDVLREDGRFIEIGRTNIWDEARVRTVRPNAGYHVLYLGDHCASSPQRVRERFDTLVRRFAAGELRPLPVRAFPVDDAVDAFRFMAQARHIGKVVLFDDAESATRIAGGAAWITGGLGGLGLAAARDLAARGCTRIVLTGRSAPDAAAEADIAQLRVAGADVRVMTGDVARLADVLQIRDAITALGWQLHTVIHAAGVLDDALLPRQEWRRFETALAPKAAGAWNLHVATADTPLAAFIVYSAGAALLGSPGQANYAAANAFIDGLVQYRRSQGLHGMSIAWGPWADVGMAARSGMDWSASGLRAIDAETGAIALRRLLREDAVHAAVLPIDWTRFPARAEDGTPRPFFDLLATATEPAAAAAVHHEPDWRGRLEAVPVTERPALVELLVTTEVVHVLGLGARRPAREQGLTDLGMDSLMAVELSNRIGRGSGLRLPSTLVFEQPTVAALSSHLLTLLGIDDGAERRRSDTRKLDALEVEGLSEDDLSVALLDELGQIGY